MSKKGILERHHILEIITTKDGTNGDYGTIIINSSRKLKELGLYGDPYKENYGLPSWLICTCTRSEHMKLHWKFDDETKRKISESLKGSVRSKESKRKQSESNKGCATHKGITTSFFGAMFKEHYGITKSQDSKLYDREYKFYKYHGYVRWEQE